MRTWISSREWNLSPSRHGTNHDIERSRSDQCRIVRGNAWDLELHYILCRNLDIFANGGHFGFWFRRRWNYVAHAWPANGFVYIPSHHPLCWPCDFSPLHETHRVSNQHQTFSFVGFLRITRRRWSLFSSLSPPKLWYWLICAKINSVFHGWHRITDPNCQWYNHRSFNWKAWLFKRKTDSQEDLCARIKGPQKKSNRIVLNLEVGSLWRVPPHRHQSWFELVKGPNLEVGRGNYCVLWNTQN